MPAECPKCRRLWDKVALGKYTCLRCDLTLDREELESLPETGDDETTKAGGREDRRPSQATVLVELGQQAELLHDPLGAAFARLDIGGHLELWPIRSRRFQNWLRHEFYSQHGKAVGSEAVSAACGTLEGMALFASPEVALRNRVAWHDGAIYYDLADEGWRAVRISEDGWQIVERPPALFRRYAHQWPQVEPVPGGDLGLLRTFLNVRPEDELLLLCKVVTDFVPDIAHPIPDFHGEKGSGKSVGQRALRRLVDPSAAETLTFPSDKAELAQQLSHHYVALYDNLDSIPAWLSDAFCRAVTGDGFTKRQLYSDDDDIIYSYRRVLMLNGVNVVAQRSDLLDRALLLELQRIPAESRREEGEYWEAFEQARPYILGGILDALRGAMRVRPQLDLQSLPRMADFARWGAAVSEALGYGANAFIDAYDENLVTQVREAVDGHIVARAVLALMEDRREWTGTPTALLQDLEDLGAAACHFKRTSSGKVAAAGWPGSPHILSRRLNEIRSNLGELGIHISDGRGAQRTIAIRRPTDEEGDSSVGSVGSVDGSSAEQARADAADATVATSGVAEGKAWETVIE